MLGLTTSLSKLLPWPRLSWVPSHCSGHFSAFLVSPSTSVYTFEVIVAWVLPAALFSVYILPQGLRDHQMYPIHLSSNLWISSLLLDTCLLSLLMEGRVKGRCPLWAVSAGRVCWQGCSLCSEMPLLVLSTPLILLLPYPTVSYRNKCDLFHYPLPGGNNSAVSKIFHTLLCNKLKIFCSLRSQHSFQRELHNSPGAGGVSGGDRRLPHLGLLIGAQHWRHLGVGGLCVGWLVLTVLGLSSLKSLAPAVPSSRNIVSFPLSTFCRPLLKAHLSDCPVLPSTSQSSSSPSSDTF